MKSDTFLSVVMTMAEAAHTFDIPYHRFCDQHQNCTKPHIQAHVDQQLLMPAQEKVLCDWVKYLGNKGQPMLKNMFVTIRTYRPIFIYLTRCTDTGVIVTHALSFYRPLAPLFLLTHAQLAVVTQSCALLYSTAHCDLLFALPIVLLRYISQACWVLCSPRLDFFHRTAIVLW